MSTSSTAVTYNFNLTLMRPADSVNEGSYPVFTSASGMTDETAIAFAKAFLAVAWPTGTTAEAYVTKHETDEIQSEGDLTTGVFV